MRRACLFCAALLLFTVTAIAQNNFVFTPVILSVDKENGQYAAGDTVKVYGMLAEECAEELVCVVEANGKNIFGPASVDLKLNEKTLLYEGVFNDPTSVLVHVYPKEDAKDKSVVGFVVAPEGFRPGFDVPEDFDKFWGKQLKAMRKCKLNPSLKPAEFPKRVKQHEDKCELYALEINMHEGPSVHAYISWPKNADKASLPVMICLHGAGLSRSDAVKAVTWASKGAIAIDINAHGYPDDQPQEYYDSLGRGELKDYRNRKVVDHDSFYFRLMYLRAVRAIDFATTLPTWDGKRIMSYGSSQGGAQAIAVAAIDKRVGAVVAHVPAITDLAGHLQDHRGGWPAYDKQMKKGDNLKAEMAVLPYYDGAVMIQKTNAKLWIEAGLIDTTCPSECVIGAFNVAPTKDKVLYTFPYRPHGPHKIDARMRPSWVKMVDEPRNAAILEWLK